ncbi:MAG TPA: hypothetical protein VIX82_02980 [Solirubrobacteraceae bacterium]
MGDGSRYEGPAFVLVHSPLLGPTCWFPVAHELEDRGHRAVVPSLRGMADSAAPQWRYAVSAVRAELAEIDSAVVLVTHGDACRVLPAIGRYLPQEVLGRLFVDGCLPPEAGPGLLGSARFLAHVRSLIREGADPHTSSLRHELPLQMGLEDRVVRGVIHGRARLPLSYYHDRVPMPQRWADGRCAYLRLSEETGGESAAQARAYGWPTAAIRGAHHLSIVTDAEAVTAVLLDLASELSASGFHGRAMSR